MENDKIKKFHNAYVNADEKELGRLWNEVAPGKVIKFFSATYLDNGENYSLDNIRNKKIWLSSPRYFNDPLDCVVNLDYYKIGEETSRDVLSNLFNASQVEIIMKSNLAKQIVFEEAEKLYSGLRAEHSKITNVIYAACFSEYENLESLTMWAHYANNHTGFCAEYDFESVNRSVELGCVPVFYTDEYSYKVTTDSVNESVENLLKLVFTKALEWQSEKEWRIVETNYNLNCKGYNINFPLPKRIYIGCRASDKLKTDLLKLCEENDIALFQMKLKPGTFTLMYDSLI